MSRKGMRSKLFYLFIGIVIVTFAVAIIGTLVEILHPLYLSDRAWQIIAGSWAGFIGEACILVVSLAKDLFGLSNPTSNVQGNLVKDLTRALANKWAQEIVKDANGDRVALDTSYTDTLDGFKNEYRNQEKSWIASLEKEFKGETLSEARRVPALKGWKPP
jgi:hypothetical protein